MGTEQKGGVPQESPIAEAYDEAYEAAIRAEALGPEAVAFAAEVASRVMQEGGGPALPGTSVLGDDNKG